MMASGASHLGAGAGEAFHPVRKDVGPVFGTGDQTLADWIHPNVVSFFFQVFMAAESVVEEPFVPANVCFSSGETFPVGDQSFEIIVMLDGEQCMDVVWHE